MIDPLVHHRRVEPMQMDEVIWSHTCSMRSHVGTNFNPQDPLWAYMVLADAPMVTFHK